MEALSLPQHITSEANGDNRAAIIIEPCYPGYGTTMGNALRRVLLSSLPGAAITAVKITGVDHEFSSLPGVKEDVVDIILNLKQLRFKVHSNEPVNVHLKVTGEVEVKAGDIKATSDVEVLNPKFHIATLTDKKAVLEMELTVAEGRGYVPVEAREKEKLDIGTIAIDAIYGPIRRVGYAVENVRVGQMTNFDKLTMDVETDGSLTPLQAVQESAKILVEHFTFIAGDALIKLESKIVKPVIVADESDNTPIEESDIAKPSKKRGRPKKDA